MSVVLKMESKNSTNDLYFRESRKLYLKISSFIKMQITNWARLIFKIGWEVQIAKEFRLKKFF